MKKVILRIIVLLVTIGIIYNGYEMVKELKSSNNVSEVSTKDIISKNKSIAIMVQDSETDNWHEATDRNSWPSPTTHGYVGAECTDSDGASIDYTNLLHFDLSTYHATIDTKNSIYCTLYFATGEPALTHLKAKGGDTFAGGGQHTTAVDGMYRFKGATVTNNYICFGTTVESTCTANASGNYMYRIIGITSAADSKIGLVANQLKIIRAVPSSTNQPWTSSSSDSSTWGSSQAKIYLNTTWYNATFVTAATKIPDASYWDSMISQHGWYITEQRSTPGTKEPQTTILPGATDNRIGLMYATDYLNANENSSSNWLFITNGWTGNPTNINEWTMSKAGPYDVWSVWYSYGTSYGYLNPYTVSDKRAVRPVFYLQSGVNLTGEGTSTHPYIITTMNNA